MRGIVSIVSVASLLTLKVTAGLGLACLIAGPAFGQTDNESQASQALVEALTEHARAIGHLKQELNELKSSDAKDKKQQQRIASLEQEIKQRSDQAGSIVRQISTTVLPPQSDPGQFVGTPGREPFAARPQFPLADEQHQIDAAAESELARRAQELGLREHQLKARIAQLEQIQRQQNAPPIEDASVKIFSLRHTKAAETAATVDSLFGTQVRVAIDDRTNQLIVSGKEKTLEAVTTLLQGLDTANSGGEGGGTATATPARTVLVRVHWLADGLPEDAGEKADKYLPDTVVEAMKDLGLEAPQLISQTVTSLTVDDQREVEYSARTPAILSKLPVTLHCKGRMRPMVGDKVPLDISITVSGQSIGCDLHGSLATPLGHYMVLGTANSVIPEQASMPGAPGIPGAEMGMMEGGFDPGAAAVDPAMGMPMGAAGEPKFNTLRFAFVVQVIEGQSYAPEE